MRQYAFFLLTALTLILTDARLQAQENDPAWSKKVGSRVTPGSHTAPGRIFVVNNFGAVSDGITLTTHAIQATIDACGKAGGGTVIFKPGSYLTGSLFLRNGVELHLDKGVELKGSQRFGDYPEIDTRIAGIEMKWPAALLNMIGIKRASITGEGRVNAQGKFCWDKYWAMRKDYDAKGLRWIVDYDCKRVRTLLVQRSSDITIKGIRFANSGFWTVQILYSEYVTVDGIVVRNNEDGHGPSTDGVDIDSSSWVLVENCDIDCNDDDFCLKAGRDWDGLRVARPTEYVVIRKCLARKGGGLLTLGSETSGDIRHVLATDLVARGTGNGFHIKSATTRGGTVEDIHIRDITMDSVGNAILFTMNWNPAYSYSTLPAGYNADSIPPHWKTLLHKVEPAEKGIPHFKDIYISGMKVASAKKGIVATGLETSLITGVHILHSQISAAVAGEISYAKDWEFNDVRITAKDGKQLVVQHSENVLPTLYIIGDSTVKNGKGKGDGNLWGWGSFLEAYFDTTRITVRNHALGGRSSRTFITEGHWDLILATLHAGDYVIMQFGHNDGGPLDDTARARGTIRGTGDETKDIYNPIMKRQETVHSYGWYMRKYLSDIKAHGATAIICSPIPRNVWVDGKCARGSQDYAKWASDIAKESGTFFIDLNNDIADIYDDMGPDKVKDFFPGDHTHTNEAGARLNAKAVVTGIEKLDHAELKTYLNPPSQAQLQPPLPQQQDILHSMRLANDYFMQKWPDAGKEIVTNIARPSHIWTRAVYYEGLMAMYGIDAQKKYYDYAVDWGVKHQWTPRNGVTVRNADDQCCGQTWIDLYAIDPQPERIAAIRTCIDNMVRTEKTDDWHWIDAIQMAMPVFTRLGVLFKDTSYFRKMYDLYHYAKFVHGTNGLYNQQDHLWWRDKDFVPPYKEPNGQNCYWSRGNGWVLAALVRVLSALPAKEPHHDEYLRDYFDMVNALAPLQRADGFWNCSLHDSIHFGGKELTGTALFTYGIGWGIRQGYLDKKTWLPVVLRAWSAMVADAVHPDGMLGWVQGTGKEPKDGQPVSYDKIPDFEDYGLGCFLLAGSEVYQIVPPPVANLDESKVPAYTEPDPLRAGDGHKVSSVKEWKTTQRPAIYKLFEKNVYGRMPAGVPLTSTVTATDSNTLGGLAIRKEILLHFSSTDTSAKLRIIEYLPKKQKGPVPVFVGYSFEGNASLESSSQWPLQTIIGRGYGLVSAWYWDIEPDRPNGWQTGIRTTLSDVLGIEPYEWSAIGAWAWGLERIADYLQTDRQIDARRMILIGHSRLGKTALWAGASDPRFAMVVSNESGEGGAALSKRDYGETVAIINAKFPHWFVPAYKQYGSNTDALPVDQHMLLSLIAPRPLYVASAEGDQFSDPKGEFLGARGAGPVYGLFGEPGLGMDPNPPAPGHPVGDWIKYHLRNGKHDITGYDWQQYMDFADKKLRTRH